MSGTTLHDQSRKDHILMCSPIFTGLNEAIIGERLTLAEEASPRQVTATHRRRRRWFVFLRLWSHR